MKKMKIIPIFAIISLFFITITPIEGISRPAYALLATDEFIVENDYELFFEDSYTAGTIQTYISMWVKPSACYPIEEGVPLCTGGFGAEYNADSDKDQYDDTYYNAIRLGLTYPGFTDITDEVPGAGLAFVYSPIPGVYSALAYFGEKTGIFVVVAEAIIAQPSYEMSSQPVINAYYDENGMTDVLVAIGEKVANELNLPGYSALITIGTLTFLVAVVIIIGKRKK